MAERLECDGMLCHRMCFRCKVCLINLRVENYARGPDGIYCKNHHKERFNDMSKSAFVYSATREFVCSA
uniref:LIM zinc-binding domain-containing protein n=1 Tax=Plectus sambesii TaxID=2011161 RepID=A0A914VUP2_9BILA